MPTAIDLMLSSKQGMIKGKPKIAVSSPELPVFEAIAATVVKTTAKDILPITILPITNNRLPVFRPIKNENEKKVRSAMTMEKTTLNNNLEAMMLTGWDS
jgi:hypothetical protein